MSVQDARGGDSAPRRVRRRVTTEPPAGSDPAPSADPSAAEPARHRGAENDERLTADKPPHY